MVKLMKKANILFKLTIVAGIFILLGTAGASDLERIGLAETFSQILLGITLILSGKLGLMILKVKRASIRRKMRRTKTVAIRQANAA
jgi:hypothetical protein